MKTYKEIVTELEGIQDSMRNPKARGGPKNPLPMPEGEIAAKSVQFLLKEVERQIELRDQATRLADAKEVHVANVPRPPAQEPEGPPDPWEMYIKTIARIGELEGEFQAWLDTIERRKVAVEEWEAKIDRLQAEVERGEARRDVIREAFSASAQRHNAERRGLTEDLAEKEGEIAALKDTIERWQATEQANRCEWEAAKERLNAKIVDLLAERHVLSGKLLMNEQDVTDMEEQTTVSTIAALAMFQKLKAAAVMAKSASAEQTAQYLLDAVNFHINGAMEVVNWLNGDTQEQDQDDQHITDGEEPR